MKRRIVSAASAMLAVFMLSAAYQRVVADNALMERNFRQRYGDAAMPTFQAWRALIAHWREAGKSGEQSEPGKLRAVNTFFNRKIRFAEDSEIWGEVDYWATPFETISRGRGDCEDFAFAKYFSLLELGVPLQRLRLTYVRARIGGPQSPITQAHMVLSYYATPDAEPQILDSLIADIRPASERPDLLPVFSFNGDGLWIGSATQKTSPVDRLNRWRDVLLRMRSEGYEP